MAKEKQFDLLLVVLRKFQEAGILTDLMLIGSWCLQFYRYHFDHPEKLPAFRTLDVDFLIPHASRIKTEVNVPEILRKEGIEVEVIDPVSLQPLDEETIIESVRKTGRLICADTSWLRCGIASEIAALVVEKAFDFLKAPIRRIALPPSPCPVSKALEDVFYPTYQDIIKAVYDTFNKKVLQGRSRYREVDAFIGPY